MNRDQFLSYYREEEHPAYRRRNTNPDSPVVPRIVSPVEPVQDVNLSKAPHPLPALPMEASERQQFQDKVAQAEITPPVSPLSGPVGAPEESPDVSPVQEEFDSPFRQKRSSFSKFGSHLPVPKRLISGGDRTEKRQPAPPLRSQGTPTSSVEQPRPPEKEFIVSREAHGAGSELSDKAPLASAPAGSQDMSVKAQPGGSHQGRKLSGAFNYFNKGSSEREPPPSSREPWKGASGRTPLVAPIKTKLGAKARNIYDSVAHSDHGRRQDPRYPVRGSSMSQDLGRAPETVRNQQQKTESTDNSATPTQTSLAETLSGPPEPPSPTTSSRYSRYTEPRTPPPKLDTRVNAENPSRSPKSEFASGLAALNVSDHPSSRFSVTTYATTEAGHSPRQSVDYSASEHPLPPLPASVTGKGGSFGTPDSLMKSTLRKPAPSASPTTESPNSKAMNALSPQAQAQSRIEAFETRRAELARRKANIESMLYELTQTIQPSSTTYDLATRGEVKKAVASLKSELDDITREDHEIGVKLIRAWKRLELSESYEGSTSLWVKRVTA